MKIDINNIKQFHSKVGQFTKPCESCGSQINGMAGLVIPITGKNLVVCETCCQQLINSGVEDLYNKQQAREQLKTFLVDFIKVHRPYQKTFSDKIEDLQKIADSINAELQKQKMIDDDIERSFVETPTEQYLIDDYGVFECPTLKSHLQIEKYFKSNGREYFECGQGSYQDEAYVFLKIGNKFYDVTINAEINSQRMDVGDRMYWVDKITNVEYEEVEKPEPKSRVIYKCELNLNMEQKDLFLEFIKTQNINISFSSIKTIGQYY